MISVRLSEEEYSALKRLCLADGARSVSDLTRDAMRALLNGASRRDGFGAHMDEFRTEIRTLNKTIEQLAATVATLKTDNNR
jgi:Arc/MetJ-type ribon-helix-helix transcriptional regulator